MSFGCTLGTCITDELHTAAYRQICPVAHPSLVDRLMLLEESALA